MKFLVAKRYDSDKEWVWFLVLGETVLAISARTYESKEAAFAAAEVVRRNVGRAQVLWVSPDVLEAVEQRHFASLPNPLGNARGVGDLAMIDAPGPWPLPTDQPVSAGVDTKAERLAGADSESRHGGENNATVQDLAE